jgi:hypothetical protein
MLTKGMIGLAALLAGTFVTVDAAIVEHAKANDKIEVVMQSDTGNAVDFSALRDQANSAVRGLVDRAEKRAKDETSRPRCLEQAWPYYSRDCLTYLASTSERGTVRTIGIARADSVQQPVSF